MSKCKLKTNHYGHTGYINAVAVSPDGSLAASGGKDGITMLWDLNDGKHLYSLEAGDIVNALVFSPNRYWLCAATASCVKIFDLESKYVSWFRFNFITFTLSVIHGYSLIFLFSINFRSIVDELKPESDIGSGNSSPECISLAWSSDGQTLYGGFTDDLVRVWTVSS